MAKPKKAPKKATAKKPMPMPPMPMGPPGGAPMFKKGGKVKC